MFNFTTTACSDASDVSSRSMLRLKTICLKYQFFYTLEVKQQNTQNYPHTDISAIFCCSGYDLNPTNSEGFTAYF